MSITLYREGLPRVQIKAAHIDSREGMLVGFTDFKVTNGSHHVMGIVMDENGDLQRLAFDQFRVQFHYDVETDQWVDENDRVVEQE